MKKQSAKPRKPKKPRKPSKPKVGEAYELFAYEKFKALFRDATVKHDDRIIGRVSGEERQIDVSVRLPGDSLIIVSCKDRTRKATIQSIDAFTSEMREVGAVSGFLMSAPGFASTTHTYARNTNVELVTIEDMNHPKWNTKVKIPVRMNDWRQANVNIDFRATTTPELEAHNKNRAISLQIDHGTPLSFDGGRTRTTLGAVIDERVFAAGLDRQKPGHVLIPDVSMDFAGVWAVGVMRFSWTPAPKVYSKEVTPDEYSHLVNHGRATTLPLHFKLLLDHSNGWTEIDPATPDVDKGLSIIIDKDTQRRPP